MIVAEIITDSIESCTMPVRSDIKRRATAHMCLMRKQFKRPYIIDHRSCIMHQAQRSDKIDKIVIDQATL